MSRTLPRIDLTMNAYSRVASLVSELCQLPAVATPDWCERAAAAVAGNVSGSKAAVLIAQVEPSGRVSAAETAGFAYSGPRPAGATTDVESVRARLERIGTVGFRPGEAAANGQIVGSLQTLPIAEPTRAGGPADALEANSSRIVAALAHIPGAAPGCCLVVYVVMPEMGTAPVDEIVPALEAGLPFLARRAAMALGDEPCTNAPWLTARENEVLEHLILGRSVKQIADVLGRSPHTVHDHVKSLHRKLNASTRGGLVARALGRTDLAAADHAAETKSVGA